MAIRSGAGVDGQTTTDVAAQGWTLVALAALTVLGLWLRLRRLGELGLIVDEGTQALAVQGILETGLPVLPSGVVYTRALLHTYLQALVAGWFGLNEWSLRLPSVLCSAAVIPAVYACARTLLDAPCLGGPRLAQGVAWLAALLTALSAWEVELARYARFYAPFQLVWVVALTCFWLGFGKLHAPYRWAFAVVAVTGFAISEFGVMIMTWFALPWLSPAMTWSVRRRQLLWAAGIGLAWFLQRRMTGWLEGLVDAPIYLPSSYTSSLEETKSALRSLVNLLINFHAPDGSPLTSVVAEWPWLWAVGLVIFAASSFLLWRMARTAGQETLGRGATVTAAALIVAALFHQVTLAVMILVAGLLWWADRCGWLWRPQLRLAYALGSVLLVGWWLALTQGLGWSADQVTAAFFNFPDLYGYFLQWYLVGWPVFFALALWGMGALLGRFLADRTIWSSVLLVGSVLLPVALTSFLQWRYLESRYTFHLYPVLLILFAYPLVDGAQALLTQGRHSRTVQAVVTVAAAVVVVGAALLLNPDAAPTAAWQVGSRGYADRRDPIKSVINWPFYAGFHQDHKTPAAYVAAQRAPGDLVVVFGPAHVVAINAHYLGGVDLALERTDLRDYVRQTEEGELVLYLTGSVLIDRGEALATWLAQPRTGTVWLLGDDRLLHSDNTYYSEAMKQVVGAMAVSRRVYTGEDGVTWVARLEPD